MLFRSTQKESNVLESKEYEYNAAERLIRYASTEQGQSGPQIEASYRHDPFGRRIAKTVKQGSQTKTTYYIYSEQGSADMGRPNCAGMSRPASNSNRAIDFPSPREPLAAHCSTGWADRW